MVGGPVSVVLAVALLPVVAYCAFSLVRRPRTPDDDPTPVDVVAWHGVMGALMLVVLVSVTTPGWDWVGVGLFVAAVLWSVLRTSSTHAVGHHARLFLMSGAMAVMLIPAGPANAAVPQRPRSASHLSGMVMPGHRTSGMLLTGTAALVVGLGMAVVALTAVRLAWRRPAPVRARLSACCEVVMAGGMVVMAASLV